ncbi:hypothetical protein AGLY_004554 [Aphis glycines]|uniref:Uncharacterized protein n=1 Tax=Aphis glycines TaxID=307491 RepID=A0A6G0TYE0_APHGL|nr:hypothetical protein AGLY_004554 [Aphis glycines]
MNFYTVQYGSPHHSRSQSVRTPGSKSTVQLQLGPNGIPKNRSNQLTLPQQRSRVASMPNTGVEEEYYRIRQFSISGKGIINRGDSLKSRRSKSNNSVASSNSSTEHLTTSNYTVIGVGCGGAGGGGGSYPGSARTSAGTSLASSRESSCASCPGITQPFRIAMLGATGVGKTSLVCQFMTSESLHIYDASIGKWCILIGCNLSNSTNRWVSGLEGLWVLGLKPSPTAVVGNVVLKSTIHLASIP